MQWGALALVALASYRLTRLVTTDELTEPLRHRLLLRYPPHAAQLEDDLGHPIPGSARLAPSMPVVFVNCAWCVGIWTTLALVLGAHFSGLVPSWQLAGFGWLAASTVVGLLAQVGG